MRAFEPWHMLVLLVVVAVLFGSKRLPDAARGLGRSLRIFKSEINQMREDDKSPRQADAPTVEPLGGKVVDREDPTHRTPGPHRDV
ncbi:MAG: sec-independent protein translocase protein TatA [Actinomycetota bacterium]|nr:sec-independent protein translocase protein TatA [Actinomycetota bacterium]